jgi:hypothetical protein
LRGLSILDLIEGILSTLDLPSESRTKQVKKLRKVDPRS